MQITDIIPRYTQLNTIISEVSNRHPIEFAQQQFVADFYTAINLLASDKILKLKQGEKTRVCFLVYKMYENIKSGNKTEWRTSILQQLEIDERYYKSKYKEPISEVPSRKSEQFAREIKELFS